LGKKPQVAAAVRHQTFTQIPRQRLVEAGAQVEALALTGQQIASSGMAGVQGAQFAAAAMMEIRRGVSQMVRGA